MLYFYASAYKESMMEALYFPIVCLSVFRPSVVC